jgi:hypothetical protein
MKEVKILLALLVMILLSCAPNQGRLDLPSYNAKSLTAGSRLWLYLKELAEPRSHALDPVLKSYAPLIWFHSQEPFAPADPLTFIKNSSLWVHDTWTWDRKITGPGQVSPSELKALGEEKSPSETYYLTYDEPTYGTGKVINWNRAHIDSFPARTGEVKTAPILWKLSSNPLAQKIGTPLPGHAWVLIEYWYHLIFNLGSSFYFANHQGEWEGISVLLDLSLDKKGLLQHRAIAVYTAAHESGEWHCASDMRKTSAGHFEVFSAWGTHATYSESGRHRVGLIFHDLTDNGRSWQSWVGLRAFANEPYVGFKGRWGPAGFLFSTSGPYAPGIDGKSIPKEASDQVPKECF